MEKYLKISVIENLSNPNNVLDMQNYSSPGFFLAKDSVGSRYIVQVIQNNIGLILGTSLSFSKDTVFPFLDFEEITKQQTNSFNNELEELKKKYASLEREYKTANSMCERWKKKAEDLQDSSLEPGLEEFREELIETKQKLAEAKRQLKEFTDHVDGPSDKERDIDAWLLNATTEYEKKIHEGRTLTDKEKQSAQSNFDNLWALLHPDGEINDFKRPTSNTTVNGEVSTANNPTDYVHIDTVIKLIKGLQ